LQTEKFSIENSILYIDEDILVINKSSGLLSIADGYQAHLPNLSDLLKTKYGKIWTVHRLDKETSGLIIFARTAQAHRSLSIQFEKRTTQKIYHALVIGKPDWNETTVDLPLRANTGRKHLTRVDTGKGKPASTTFQVLERLHGCVLLVCNPHSGYRHQIRAHLYALDLKLLGDRLYTFPSNETNLFVWAERMMLHASRLSFVHPSTGETVEYFSPYPHDFSDMLMKIKKAGI